MPGKHRAERVQGRPARNGTGRAARPRCGAQDVSNARL